MTEPLAHADISVINGSLNGAWIMISGGVLLFLFIVLQRSIVGSLRLGGST